MPKLPARSRLEYDDLRMYGPEDEPLCGTCGDPFRVNACREAGFVGTDGEIAARCVEAFRVWIDTPYWRNNWQGEESEAARAALFAALPELRGKNLACACPLDQPCHADVLLELANRGDSA